MMLFFFRREISELENFYLNDLRGSGIDSLLHLNTQRERRKLSFFYLFSWKSKHANLLNK